MKPETPELNNILKYLHDLAMHDKPNPLQSIVDFVTSEKAQQVFEKVLDSIVADGCPDYYTYFTSDEGIDNLLKLKDTDNEMYYKAIIYGTALINTLTRILEMPFVVVMTPEDLSKTYYIKLTTKTEE
jgi:hypothetical protein